MKKLMIAAAIVCAAAFAQAANVSWGSGAMMTAADKNGGWSSTGVAQAQADVLLSVYLLDTKEAYDALAGKSAADLYAWSKDKTADKTAHTLNGETYGAAATASITGEANKWYYSVVVAEYTDASFGEMYMATAKSGQAGTTGALNMSGIFGMPSGVKDWSPAAVPEPTSGLLLLLGVAGMALRRRRA